MVSARAPALVALAAAALLIAVATLHHSSAPASLMQSQMGMERRMQALKELGAQRTVYDAERAAYSSGFEAGEERAERSVMLDDRSAKAHKSEVASMPSYEQRAMLVAMRTDEAAATRKMARAGFQAEELAAMHTGMEKANFHAEELAAVHRGMAKANFQAEELAAVHSGMEKANFQAEELAAVHSGMEKANFQAEELAAVHAGMEKANAKVERERAFSLQRERALINQQERAHAAPTQRAIAADVRALAAERLARKQLREVTSGKEGEMNAPGSKGASELMAFCRKSFAHDQLLERFCFDKLDSLPHQAPPQLQGQQVVSAPTLELAMRKAMAMGVEGPPKFAALENKKTGGYALFQVKPASARPLQTSLAQKGGCDEDKPCKLHGARQEEAHQQMMAQMEAVKEGCEEDKPCKLHGARQGQQQMMAQAPQRPIEVDARSLRGSIAKARALGFKGYPQAVVYHPAGGQERTYLAAPQGPQTQSLAQGFPAAPFAAGQDHVQAEVHATKQGVEVDAGSLKDSIRDAHAMGFQGVPREVVYKPAGGRMVTYKLAEQDPVDTPVRARRY